MIECKVLDPAKRNRTDQVLQYRSVEQSDRLL
mgnify:CR=1 FL=1